MLTVQERLEANAIIERLVENEPTFLAADARRLVEILPIQVEPKKFTFGFGLSRPGGKFRGKAAGVGDVEMDREAVNKEWSTDPREPYKIGGYEVTHNHGWITIALMWEKTKMDQTGLSCQLEYDPASRNPKRMHIARQKSYKAPFLPFIFNYTDYEPWKEPRVHDSPVA